MTLSRYQGLFHLVDVLPTILHLVNPSHSLHNLDGINQWPALNGMTTPPRDSMVHNIDDDLVPNVLNRDVNQKFQIAVRQNNFKLIWGRARMLHRYVVFKYPWSLINKGAI